MPSPKRAIPENKLFEVVTCRNGGFLQDILKDRFTSILTVLHEILKGSDGWISSSYASSSVFQLRRPGARRSLREISLRKLIVSGSQVRVVITDTDLTFPLKPVIRTFENTEIDEFLDTLKKEFTHADHSDSIGSR